MNRSVDEVLREADEALAKLKLTLIHTSHLVCPQCDKVLKKGDMPGNWKCTSCGNIYYRK